MPTPSTAVLPKPRSEDEFEDIAVDCLRIRWRDPNAVRNGRRGQSQHGVDIIGHPPWLNGKTAGGQCKNTESLTLLDVTREVEKAKTFPGGLSEFYVVTSSDRDARLQAAVFQYVASNPPPFKVVLLFWEDVVSEIANDSNLVAKHWKGFGQSGTSDAPSSTDRAYDEETRIAEAQHLYQAALVDVVVERVSRKDFEQNLRRIGHDNILDDVADGTSYSALARYTVTRAIVGDWLRDLLGALPSDVREDARLQPVRKFATDAPSTAGHRRRRIAMLLQHMARLEGQQVQTPGFLWIARGHERGDEAAIENEDPELLDYMGAIDLESIRDHLNDVLETTLCLISELDSDTVIAEEVPDAYVKLRRGLNARVKILRHALKHGVPERAASDYGKLITERDEAVERLVQRLSDGE